MTDVYLVMTIILLAFCYISFTLGEFHAFRKIRRMLDDETGEE